MAFTLIELMVAVALVGILNVVVFRSMMVLFEQRKLRSAAVELASYLQVARNVAMSQNIPCTIAMSTSDGGTFTPDATPKVNSCRGGTIAPNLKLAASGSRDLSTKDKKATGRGTYPLTFNPEGTVSTGATVVLRSKAVPEGGWCVDVAPPLATIRIGWLQGQTDEGDCNFSVEE